MSEAVRVEISGAELGPPPAEAPVRREADPRERLHQLARELVRGRNRALLMEYLKLRRAAKG